MPNVRVELSRIVVDVKVEIWVDAEPKNSNCCGKVRCVEPRLLEDGMLLVSAPNMEFIEGMLYGKRL